MTDQEINIAIAEECGYKNVTPLMVKNVTRKGDDRFVGVTSNKGWIPNYCADLNAMHEAEKTLRKEQFMKYQFELEGFLDMVIFAPAHYRAQAFLRTLGKWRD